MSATVETAIKLIREIDEQVSTIEAEAKNKVNELKVKRSTLEAWLAKKSLEEGVDSFKSAQYGTVFWTTTAFCSVADWDATFKYIQDNKAWELLTHAVSKKVVTDLVGSGKDVPPGLSYGTRRTLNIRKPSVTA